MVEQRSTTPIAPLPVAIRVLRRLNPLVMGIIESPMHGILSRDLLLLNYRGRRSGKDYRLPLSYVEHDGTLYLCTRPDVAQWWRNLRGGVEVTIRLKGKQHKAHADVVPSTTPEALAGLKAFVEHNPRTGRDLYSVGLQADGQANQEELVREVANSIVVRIVPEAD